MQTLNEQKAENPIAGTGVNDLDETYIYSHDDEWDAPDWDAVWAEEYEDD